jgi:hypothetical protein
MRKPVTNALGSWYACTSDSILQILPLDVELAVLRMTLERKRGEEESSTRAEEKRDGLG